MEWPRVPHDEQTVLKRYIKLLVILAFAVFFISACLRSGNDDYVIGESKAYDATLFRQNCAICHGPEGEGKTLDDGTVVPSLREGDFKARTEFQIYHQIADGGNGMLPFRKQLTDREIRLLVALVQNDLRAGK